DHIRARHRARGGGRGAARALALSLPDSRRNPDREMLRHRRARRARLGSRRDRRRGVARRRRIGPCRLCVGRLQVRDRLRAVAARAFVPAGGFVRGRQIMTRLAAIAGIAVLAVAALLTDNAFFQHLMIMVLFWTLLGASWNLLGGFAGQVSFGHAVFLGVGAYVTMLLYLRLGVSPLVGMLAGGLLRAALALPIRLLFLRLRRA